MARYDFRMRFFITIVAVVGGALAFAYRHAIDPAAMAETIQGQIHAQFA